MTRVDTYEALCYQCFYGASETGFCTLKKDCNKCIISDENGTCFCIKEKPDDEYTCPRFKYKYLRG